MADAPYGWRRVAPFAEHYRRKDGWYVRPYASGNPSVKGQRFCAIWPPGAGDGPLMGSRGTTPRVRTWPSGLHGMRAIDKEFPLPTEEKAG